MMMIMMMMMMIMIMKKEGSTMQHAPNHAAELAPEALSIVILNRIRPQVEEYL